MASPPANAPDELLSRYRIARAQQALFDVPGAGYDEFVDAAGRVRPAWRELAEWVGRLGGRGLDALRSMVRELVDNDGITYTRPDRPHEPGPWHLDPLPLVLSAADWETLETGLLQRSRLLDAVLTDLYGPRETLTSGLLPAQLVFAHPGYLRAAHGITVPGRRQLFLHGCDVSRGADGGFLVHADWTQAPSGAGYALADRRVVAHANPDLYQRIGPRPVSLWAQALRLALIDAAPVSAEEPVVVVLSPGSQSETFFDQAHLAGVLGFPLVESTDLVVQDGRLWMRSMGTLQPVDVVLRRVDADYADPLDLRQDSRLGVAGLVEVLRRGAVTVVNTLGSGVLESPGLQRFLPELCERMLGESPLLASPPMYWGGIDTERSHLLARLSSLLIRSVTGGETIVGAELSASRRAELAARIEAEPWRWVGQELPQFSCAPTAFAPGGLSSAPVVMRLFTVAQRDGYAPMVGGLGGLLAPGAAGYPLKTLAAKDVWVRTAARATAEAATAAPRLPAVTPSATREVSSPRVLSEQFWIGRYAERAEGAARLLTVTRERYDEYHREPGDRADLPGSAVVPVLLRALTRITGTDGGDVDDTALVAAAPDMLWSLTTDRRRPGSLAQSVEGLGLALRAVRDQMSNDTWMVITGVERALQHAGDAPTVAALALPTHLVLAGMLALAGVADESLVRDIGWTMMDIGRRIERGLALTTLLDSTLTADRGPAEPAVIEAVLVACESSVTYRRRNPGTTSVAAVAELLLFDADNPRSLAFTLERLRADLRALPGATGSSRAERLVDDLATRLRRTAPAALAEVGADGRRPALADLMTTANAALRDLAAVITTTHLTLPGEIQPLWGPEERRVVR
jgi:uncharacterized circularly permuted ATP-grasp superfamily protein/uncharacterized alpha-E superfamily protein